MLTTAFNGRLGITGGEISPDLVVLAIEIGPDHHQPEGIVHGGVWCGIVEAAASAGAVAWYGERGRSVGVSNQTDFLWPSVDGRFTARAVPIHRGRLQQVWTVEIVDESGRLTARRQVRLQSLPVDEARS